MTVRVLFFSTLRDLTGAEEVVETLDDGRVWRVADLLERFHARHPGLRAWDSRILVAVDREWTDRDRVLEDGQEIAVMPPVQGG